MDGTIVTPYATEPREMIERCIASVRAQTVPVHHLLVADGNPRPWISQAGVKHAALDRRYNDWGNTPRAYGMKNAAEGGASFIALLDVDNVYDPDHIESCLDTLRRYPGADLIASRRRFVRYNPDGTYTSSSAIDEPQSEHIDTSCFFFLPGAYELARYMWANGPQECARYRYSVDRHVYGALKAANKFIAFTNRETVTYTIHSVEASARHEAK